MSTTRQLLPVQIRTVPVPVSLDDDDAWAVHAVAALERTVYDATWGHHDFAYEARETLVKLRDERYTLRVQLVAVTPGSTRDVVGVAFLRLPQRANTHLAEVDVLVHPDLVGHGVDDALLTAALERVREHGRRVVILSSEHPGEPGTDGDVLLAPTGSGRIARTDAGAALAERAGFVLEQADRYSVLPLPVPPDRLAELRAAAASVAGPDYRTITWNDACPDTWVDQFARLKTRMSTDAPSAGLDIVEDPWDAERVRAAEASIAESGRGALVTAAVHVPTGTLAAFTMVEYPATADEVVFQEDTLVLREHRGRRLGMLVKAVNLEHLAQHRPEARRVHTWNAGENSYMLAINVALGFAPAGVEGTWQKRLG